MIWRLLRRPRIAVLALALALLGAGAAVLLWAQYHLRAAQQAIERGALDEAQHHLDRRLQVPFGRAAVHLLAAQTARRRNKYDEAERHLAACLDLEGMTEGVALERLLLTAQQGDDTDVERLLQDRELNRADDAEAVLILEALAKGYLNRFLEVDALVCLDRLLQRRPRHPWAVLMRAHVWEDLARNERTERDLEALRDYQQAVELNPSFEARLGLAGTLYRVGRPWDARREYQRLHAEQADHPEVLFGLARCRWSLHEVDEARRLLDDLLGRQPGHAAALLERGRLLVHDGRLAEAEEWLRRAEAAAPPGDREPTRLLCQCLEAERKDEKARRCRERLRQKEADVLRIDLLTLRANRDPHNVPLRYEIATNLMRLGREQEGVAGLFLVLEQQPRHGPAHAALADYFERTGQPARAARHRREALPTLPVRP